MVMWEGCIRLQLTFSSGKLYANFEKFFFLLKMNVKFRNIQIRNIPNTKIFVTEFFQFLSGLCTYLLRYT